MASHLSVASQKNQLDVVKLLIAAGANVNKARHTVSKPFCVVAQRWFAGVASALLAAGVHHAVVYGVTRKSA